MFVQLRKGRLALAVTLLAVFCLGFAVPALAEDEVYPTSPEDAKITKIIDGPLGISTAADDYTFTFAGAGKVSKDGTKLVSDGVAQDSNTIKEGDTIPVVGANGKVVVSGENITNNNSIGPDESLRQTTVSVPLSNVFAGVTFDHAGVYTYRVTEDPATTNVTGAFLNSSKASYLVRVYVINNDDSGNGTTVDKVTVEREADDDGKAKSEKVDSTKPETDANGKITDAGSDDEVSGDSRGRNVDGFTFANEYAKGGLLVVRKMAEGDYANKNEEFPITLTITDPAAADAPGCCLTYMVTGGTDQTENLNSEGRHRQIDGVSGASDYMVLFNSKNQAVIKANLKHGGAITVTGLYGAYQEQADEQGNHRIKFTSGLKNGTTFEVTESNFGLYKASGYVDDKVEGSTGPTVTKGSDGTYTIDSTGLLEFTTTSKQLTISDTVATDGSTIYVLNLFEDSNANPTGIIINNLPYILMVAIPVGVFAVMFVNKRRQSSAA